MLLSSVTTYAVHLVYITFVENFKQTIYLLNAKKIYDQSDLVRSQFGQYRRYLWKLAPLNQRLPRSFTTKRSVLRITKNLQGLAVSEEHHDEFAKNDAFHHHTA